MTDGITAEQFEAAEGLGDWRVVEEGACAFYRTESLADGARFVEAISKLEGIGPRRPDVDLRHDGLTVRIITTTAEWYGPTEQDVELARRISAVARDQGLVADPTAMQSLLVVPGAPGGIDIIPFWRAVLGYEPRIDSPEEDLVDPRHRSPSFWFESMDEPRGDGGGAIHLAVWVPYEQAEARVAAALAAGGRMVRDDRAPAWWTLADPAGNEADIATTRNRG